jgi:hypothetical protein
MWDRTGQLGESGEYRTRMLRVICFHIQSFEGDSPRLCRLRIASIGPCCNKHWVVYWPIRDLWGPTNLVASTVDKLDDTPLYFTDDIEIVFGPPMNYPSRFRVEDGTRVRWVRLNYLIVIMKGGHSCCLRGSHVSCCQINTFQGDYWFEFLWHTRIWVRLVHCVQMQKCYITIFTWNLWLGLIMTNW